MAMSWNKGLTKETSPSIARIAAKKKEWWATTDTTETRKKIGVASKGKVFKRGAEHHSWKGGRYVDKRDGYVLIRAVGHQLARSDGYVLEHRLVMSEIIGRPIYGDEDVNHINGDKTDNRPENLRLVRHYAHYEEMACPKCEFKFWTR